MIIFLHGRDSFRSNQKLAEIKNKFLLKDPAGTGLSVFDFEDKADTEKVVNAMESGNLLAPKRLVIAKNLMAAGTEAQQKNLQDFLKKEKWLKDDKNTVAVFWEAESPKKSDALFKLLEKCAQSQEFEKLSGVKLEQWSLRRLKNMDDKASISKTALEKLLAYAGEDTHLLNGEIQKLTAHADEKMITEEDVELLVKANLSSNIFNTIDALGSNDKKTALKLLHRHLEKGEDPFYLLAMFAYQFRNLLKVTDLKNKYGSNEYALARESRLHPFVIKKSLAQIRNFSREKLMNIYQKLGGLDTAVKTGKIEIRLALDKFIVEI